MHATVKLNPSVFAKFMQETSANRETAEQAFRELHKFLAVSATSNGPCAPSDIVDEFWHCFVLHTIDYAEYCQNAFGCFMHHVPSDDHSANLTAYARTRELLAKTFGNLDERFWPPANNSLLCGSSCKVGDCRPITL